MGDWAGSAPVAPLHVGSYGIYTPWDMQAIVAGGGAVSITWVANLAIYVPVTFPFAYRLKRFWWINGSTAASNVDVGIYTPGGAQIAHAGTTAQSGASAQQYVTPASETLLSAGRYYLAYVCSGTTSAGWGSVTWTASSLRFGGCLQQALGSASLPATWTPAAVTNALYPHCGISRTSTGF